MRESLYGQPPGAQGPRQGRVAPRGGRVGGEGSAVPPQGTRQLAQGRRQGRQAALEDAPLRLHLCVHILVHVRRGGVDRRSIKVLRKFPDMVAVLDTQLEKADTADARAQRSLLPVLVRYVKVFRTVVSLPSPNPGRIAQLRSAGSPGVPVLAGLRQPRDAHPDPDAPEADGADGARVGPEHAPG